MRNYKTPRGKHREDALQINHSRTLYDPSARILEIKAKINKWNLIKIKSLLHNKGNCKQVENTAFRMGKNNSK